MNENITEYLVDFAFGQSMPVQTEESLSGFQFMQQARNGLKADEGRNDDPGQGGVSQQENTSFQPVFHEKKKVPDYS